MIHAGGDGEALRAGAVGHEQFPSVAVEAHKYPAGGGEAVQIQMHGDFASGFHGARASNVLKTNSSDEAIENRVAIVRIPEIVQNIKEVLEHVKPNERVEITAARNGISYVAFAPVVKPGCVGIMFEEDSGRIGP